MDECDPSDHGNHASPARPGSSGHTRHAIDIVTRLIDAQAARTPNRIAIAWSGGPAWTYASLIIRADAIARSLLGNGISTGEAVAMYLPRRPEMVAAALGVMRAGAAYLPLDPAYPPERLHYMVRHARVRHMLVPHATMVPGLLTADMRVLELDDLDSADAPEMALPAVNGHDLAYVLFTSGSTGKPKGVRTLHSNLGNNLLSICREPGVSENDVFGAFTTLAFDASIHELFLPLLVGGRLVIATEQEQSDPDAAAALMRAHPMTLLEITPTQLQLMLARGRIRQLRGIGLWAGGEVLPRDVAEKVLPECRELWNTYGPTETTIESTIHRVTHGTGPVPIGKPIANTHVYILDESGLPVADGGIGEIWIGGAGVADGYVNDAEQTAARFITDPFARDGSCMYRTGDLGQRINGLLYFHGRIDDQIQINGARIEPGDIEAVARSVTGVHDAVAVARSVSDGELHLALYVVVDSDTDPLAQVRRALRQRLPGCMQPRTIEVLDTLPRTPSGKVDRKALAAVPMPAATTPSAGPRPGATTAGISRADDDGKWSPLVAIQAYGERPPLFLIHGQSGTTTEYVPLARGLGAKQPVYGVQAYGLDGVHPPSSSIPEMADRYIAGIRQVQPSGPYFVGGAAMGGLIACEIAGQLQQLGETVGLLAVLESTDPTDRHPQPRNHAGGLPTALPARWRASLDRGRVQRARAAGRALPPGLRHREIARAHANAIATCRPSAGDTHLVLFQQRAQRQENTDTSSGDWAEHTRGSVEVIPVAANGGAFLEHPDLLVQLRSVLQRAQDRDT